MKKIKTLNEEINRIKGLMSYENGQYKNPIISEQDSEGQINCFGFSDTTSVSNVESYTPLMEWWCKHPKKDGVKESIKYWEGGSAGMRDNQTNAHKNLITNLNDMINSPLFVEFKAPFTKLKQKLDNLINQNLYIQFNAFKNASGRYNFEMGYLIGKNTVGKMEKDGKINDRLFGVDGVKLKRFVNSVLGSNGEYVDRFMKKASENTSRDAGKIKALITMSDQDKIDILNQLSKKVNNHFRGKNVSVEKGIKRATDIKLKQKGQQITKTDGTTTETQTMTSELTYPNIDTPKESFPEMYNMFGDDEYVLSEDRKNNINNLLKEGINNILTQKGKITKIIYGSAASTSKVRTSFGGVEAGGVEGMSSENNKPLVKARVQNINTTIKNLIDNNDTLSGIDNLTVEMGENLEKPNQGPKWLTYDGTYGPLYNKALESDKKLTPQKFYSKRDKDSNIKKEYNKIFGKHRWSYGYIKLEYEIEDATEEPSVEYAVSGDWKIYIKWFQLPPINPPKLPPKQGGVKLYPTKSSSECPKFGNKGWWNDLGKGGY